MGTCCTESTGMRCAIWILMIVIICLDGIVLLLWFGIAKAAAKIACTKYDEELYARADKDCVDKKHAEFLIWWAIGVVLYFICHIFAIVGVYKWWAHGKYCENKIIAEM